MRHFLKLYHFGRFLTFVDQAKERVMEEGVSMKAKEEDESEWRQTWGPVAHTSRPRRMREKEEKADKKERDVRPSRGAQVREEESRA